MDKLRINPKFKDLIPPLLPDEYARLEELIITEGIRDALIVWNGVIVDGHNRFEIAERLGITDYPVVEKDFTDESDVMVWIISTQLGRRNLSSLDRIELAKKSRPILREKAKENMSLGGGDKKSGLLILGNPIDEKIHTHKELAKLAGVSPETMRKGEKVLENASPELIQEVRTNKKKINTAYREMQTGTVICKGCGLEKPASRFSGDRKGLCMDCENAYRKEAKRVHKEKLQEGEELQEAKLLPETPENATPPVIEESLVTDVLLPKSDDIQLNSSETELPTDEGSLMIKELQAETPTNSSSEEGAQKSDKKAYSDESENKGEELQLEDVDNVVDIENVPSTADIDEILNTNEANLSINPNYTIEAFQVEFRENANSYIELAKRFIAGHYSPLWKQQENKSIAIAALDEVITAMENLKGTIKT